METVIKEITAGILHRRIVCRVPDVVLGPKRRNAKVNPTSLAQNLYNLKLSWRELELWIAANFGRRDYMITLTYDQAHLPLNKDAAEKKYMNRFIRNFRDIRTRRGELLKYIYVTEGLHGKAHYEFLAEDGELEDKRIHHHMIINNAGPNCIEEIRSLWGGGYVRIEPIDVHYYEELAKYLTKEAREFGREKPGKRSWKRSMNLTKYKVEYHSVAIDGISIEPPKGAVDYTSYHEKNPYGFADCIGDRYLLFPTEPRPDYSYNQGRRRKRPPNN